MLPHLLDLYIVKLINELNYIIMDLYINYWVPIATYPCLGE
jgi:hypothetical protein